MRDVIVVINQILDIAPNEYDRIGELRVRLNYIIEDSKYRAPELICISWKDLSVVLNQIIVPEACVITEWTWRDDIMELFLEGLWSEQTGKSKTPIC